MQNKTKRFIINTIAIIAAVISLTIIMIPSVSVFAADKESVINIDAQQSLRDLSRVELVTAAFKKCVPKYVTRRDNNRLSVFDSNIVDVGPWLEKHILGSDAGGDGAIKCDEKNDAIIDAFANEVGVNHNGILCNKNDNFNSPGLIAWLVPEGTTPTGVNIGISDASRKQYPNGCSVFGVNGTKGAEGGYFDKEKVEASNGTSSPTFYFNPQGGPHTLGAEYVDGNDYVREVYAEWRRNSNLNKYLRTYGETNSDKISEYAYYYMDRQDYFAQCGEVKSTKEQGGMPISKVDANGAISTEYYLVQNQTAKIGKLDGQKTDCAAIAKRINNDKDEWRTKMAEIYKDECNKKAAEIWKFEYYKAQVITGTKASGMAVVVLPTGIYKLSTNALSGKEELINIEESDDPLGTETTYTLDEAKSLFGKKFWQNYTEETDGEGNKVKNISSFTDKDKENANTVIADYKKYKKNYFADVKKNEKDEYGEFTCNVPDGWTVEDQQGQSSGDNQDSESGDSDPCYDAGIEGMSWVLCPAINNTSNTVDGIEQILRDWLTIPVNEGTDGTFGIYAQANGTNGDVQEGTYVGWNIFRNIANVILAIIFLVIIFSQLTGYGIDNYGIKKMLPKLIVMAVLINFSYILCKIAVDISNILGMGLDDLLKGIGNSIAEVGGRSSDYTTSAVVATLFAGIAAAGTVASAAAGSSGVMIVVTLLLALLVALVAVLIFFIMLSVRIMIVAVFIILTPVALACYILPNTKNLFKKWWKIFEAALMVFPICGAMYGASYIVKAIVGGDSGGFIPGIIAVIAPFLPFFALPSLLKGALAGLTAVGGAITAIGSGLKKGAQRGKGAIENTKAYKGAQERAADRSAERRATRIRNRLQNAANRRGGINNLSNSQRRRLYQANTLLNEQEKQRIQDSVGATPLDADATRTRLENEREQQMARDSIGVLRITPEMARRRAQAERSSQEFKAAQEQYSNYTRDQLLEEAGFRRDASGRLTVGGASRIDINQPGGSERMRALLSTMEANGMEHDIATTLQNNDVSNDAGIMSTLNGFNNKVLKAYGKRGAGQSYDQFMQGTGDNSMQGYIKSKDADFVNGLDDKALEQIASYNGGDAINDDVLNRAVIDLKGDAREQAKNIMINRLKNGNFSTKGENLAGYSDDVFAEIAKYSNGRQAIVAASDSLSAEQVKKLGQVRRQYINQQRQASGKAPI